MQRRDMRVGIVGMGTIGQAIAQALDRGDMTAQLTAVSSRDLDKARRFAMTLEQRPEVVDLGALILSCDLVIEAATQAALADIAPRTLEAGKDLMVLSVGGLLDHPEWADLAARHGCRMYIPSGAVVGLDGVKGACVAGRGGDNYLAQTAPGAGGVSVCRGAGAGCICFDNRDRHFRG
jgi:aspartate dehydrogenase